MEFRSFDYFEETVHVYDDHDAPFHNIPPHDSRFIDQKLFAGRKGLPLPKYEEKEPFQVHKATFHCGGIIGDAPAHVGEAAADVGGAGEVGAGVGDAGSNFGEDAADEHATDLTDIIGTDADDDKDITELIASGREKLAAVPSDGGEPMAVSASGGGAAAEAKKEEKVEDKERPTRRWDSVFWMSRLMG